ncbi:unnamed protein product [Soboliphyme baturini]|uniref:HDAC4_Gln domain-containing protein n=1 Tax=Soboliphyme baturini TaxID=241478 RepID=A0A183J7K9_9BILA|nr:unnamed protein product [Soboliphyme baturini]
MQQQPPPNPVMPPNVLVGGGATGGGGGASTPSGGLQPSSSAVQQLLQQQQSFYMQHQQQLSDLMRGQLLALQERLHLSVVHQSQLMQQLSQCRERKLLGQVLLGRYLFSLFPDLFTFASFLFVTIYFT